MADGFRRHGNGRQVIATNRINGLILVFKSCRETSAAFHYHREWANEALIRHGGKEFVTSDKRWRIRGSEDKSR